MEKIILETHNPQWLETFESEKTALLHALPDVFVHHVGSTAVKDLLAKPIIDICMESPAFPPIAEQLEKLGNLGYENRGESGVPGRIWFVKGEPRKFNLHYCAVGSPVVKKQIAFREALQKNPTLRREYETLKTTNASGHDIDSAIYARSKTNLIDSVMNGTFNSSPD